MSLLISVVLVAIAFSSRVLFFVRSLSFILLREISTLSFSIFLYTIFFSISLYSAQIQEKTDQSNSEYGHFSRSESYHDK